MMNIHCSHLIQYGTLAKAFEGWTQSEQFRKAHANARGNKEIYLGAPNFEGF